MPPREMTVRVLRIAIAAAVIVPCLLFAYASWVSYRSANMLADERIVRSLDVQQEQAVKAFQLIDNTLNGAASWLDFQMIGSERRNRDFISNSES